MFHGSSISFSGRIADVIGYAKLYKVWSTQVIGKMGWVGREVGKMWRLASKPNCKAYLQNGYDIRRPTRWTQISNIHYSGRIPPNIQIYIRTPESALPRDVDSAFADLVLFLVFVPLGFHSRWRRGLHEVAFGPVLSSLYFDFLC